MLRVGQLSCAHRAQLKGHSYAEVLHRELCVLSSLSLGYRPAIGCREWMKGLGAVTESLPKGQLKPGLAVLQLPLLLLQLLFRLHYRRAGQPRRSNPLSCSRWQRDRRSGMNVS